MAVDVIIKMNKFIKKKISLEDLLFEEMNYGIMDEAYRLDEGKVGEYTVVFNTKNICRGYEVSLTKGEINIRMPLPTSLEDIRFFYEYIKKVCKKIHTKTFIRNEEKTTFDRINDYIEADLEASKKALKRIEKDIDDGIYENMHIFGAINPICIDKKTLLEIDDNPIKLGELMNNLQKMDVYYAKANIYQRKDNTYFGVYVLTVNVDTVLPYKATAFMIANDLKISDWNIGFVINENVEGFISYQDFLSHINKDKKYDTEHFIITINEKKIKELLSKYKVEL